MTFILPLVQFGISGPIPGRRPQKSAAADIKTQARAAVLLRSAAPAARRLARAQPHVARGMVSETLTLMKKSKKAAAMQRVPHLSIRNAVTFWS